MVEIARIIVRWFLAGLALAAMLGALAGIIVAAGWF